MSIRKLGKVSAATVLAAALLWPAAALASELVMFERADCVWCQRWDREVGAAYALTDEAKQLPLRRVDLDRQSDSGVTLAAPVIFTPTFVLVDEGREVGRITGYQSNDTFWGLLGVLAAKLKPAREPARI
jgi:thioredoxin-related protein